MCSLIEKYGRNSFNRFGDDLCEFILSYLPLSDCFGLQCVCKQFNAFVFTKQTRLTISNFRNYFWKVFGEYENSIITELITVNNRIEEQNNTINNDLLKYVMKKCANINRIIIDCNYVIYEETINIIRSACKRIKYLTIYESPRPTHISVNCWKQFAQNLESLTFENIGSIDIIVTIMQLCPKLKKIHSDYDIERCFGRCFKEKTKFSTNIKSVRHFVIDEKQDFESFNIFANHFCRQLKSFSIWFDFVFEITDIESQTMNGLSKFENLEHLYCAFPLENDRHCIELLKLIGLKCLRLKVLKIENLDATLREVFRNRFQSLEKLIIETFYVNENLEFLKTCVNLIELKVTAEYSPLDGSEFNDIHLYLPHLKTVDIRIDFNLGKQILIIILKHLAKLPNLCKLKIGYACESDCDITADDVISFIDNCSTIRIITIYRKHTTFDDRYIQDYIESNKRKIQIKNKITINDN